MSHEFAMTMKQPHIALGLRQPIGRRLPQGVLAWNVGLLTLSIAMGCFYIVQVSFSMSKGYALRDVEKRVDGLKTETMTLQDKVATLSSMQALNARATELGFVPVDQVEYVTPSPAAVAVAK